MPNSLTQVSFVVATCNRAERPEKCITAILRADVPRGLDYEIIVVDNASNDNTRAMASRLAVGAVRPVVYHYEPRRGASFARNKGIQEARGTIIAIIDDDCYVAADYLLKLKELVDLNPGVGMFGGRVELFDPTALPIAIRTMTQRIAFRDSAQLFSLIPGCNMAFRKPILTQVGLYNTNLGPGSRWRLVAEDVDLIYRCFKAGFTIEYFPDLLVRHDHGRTHADSERISTDYQYGRGAFYAKHILAGDRTVLKMAYWEGVRLFKNIVRRGAHKTERPKSLRTMKHLLIGACGWCGTAVLTASEVITRNVRPKGTDLPLRSQNRQFPGSWPE